MNAVWVRRRWLVAVGVALVVSLVPVAGVGAIVGGTPSSIREHPWLVSLHDEDGQQCGGALIRLDVVLSAAHCTEGYSAADIQIVAGSTRADGRGGQRRSVVDIVEPAAYARSDGFDVALVYLRRPVRRTARVQTIGLAAAPDLRSAAEGVIAGWGVVGELDGGVMRVRDATVGLLSDGPCRRQMRRAGERIVPRRELCARAGPTDSCYGDSGGPLVIRNVDGEPVVAGIVSWGVECAGTTPGVYAEVPFFRRWIIKRL